jgi:hypothetical protein
MDKYLERLKNGTLKLYALEKGRSRSLSGSPGPSG